METPYLYFTIKTNYKQMQIKPIEWINRSTAIQEIVIAGFHQAGKVPMTKKESEIMIKLLLAPKDTSIPEKEKDFVQRVLEKRAEVLGYKIDDRTSLFLAYISCNPAIAVLYAWYLKSQCNQLNIKEITFEVLCEKIFPFGFPSEADLNNIWDNQKVERLEAFQSDNLVDYLSAGLSILNENKS